MKTTIHREGDRVWPEGVEGWAVHEVGLKAWEFDLGRRRDLETGIGIKTTMPFDGRRTV